MAVGPLHPKQGPAGMRAQRPEGPSGEMKTPPVGGRWGVYLSLAGQVSRPLVTYLGSILVPINLSSTRA